MIINFVKHFLKTKISTFLSDQTYINWDSLRKLSRSANDLIDPSLSAPCFFLNNFTLLHFDPQELQNTSKTCFKKPQRLS